MTGDSLTGRPWERFYIEKILVQRLNANIRGLVVPFLQVAAMMLLFMITTGKLLPHAPIKH
jgi:hypothetical protein